MNTSNFTCNIRFIIAFIIGTSLFSCQENCDRRIQICEVIPKSGKVGDTIQLHVQDYGSDADVYFGDKRVSARDLGDYKISVIVPPGVQDSSFISVSISQCMGISYDQSLFVRE